MKRVLKHLPAFLAAITFETWVTPAAAQDFRVTAVSLDSENRPRLEFPSNTNSYYVLYRGYEVTNINTPIVLVLGVDAHGALIDAGPLSNLNLPRFYRLREIPIAQPADTDGDLIDDLYELNWSAILNPLLTSDGGEDPDNDDLTNTEEYQASTNPMLTDSDGDGWIDSIELNDKTDPLNPASRPQQSLLSSPPVLAALPSPDGAGSSGTATFISKPPLLAEIPSPDAAGTKGAGVLMAAPGVLAQVVSPDAAGATGFSAIVAQPPLLVEIPGPDRFGTAGSFTVIALPTTAVAVESADAAGASGNANHLARPPVSIRVSTQ